MLVKVDFSLPVFRMLYNDLYNRVLTRAVEDGDSEEAVKARFLALIAGDERVQLVVQVDNNTIKGHCLFTYTPPSIFVEQLTTDSKTGEDFTRECIEYGESLSGVEIVKMFTSESKYRAFRKKYEFEVEKVVMSRTVKRD